MRTLAHFVAIAAMASLTVAIAFAQAPKKPATDTTIAPLVGNAVKGDTLYQNRCTVCHSLDTNRIGPMHRGVVGRKVASVAGFTYSKPLRAQKFIWTEKNLDIWLTNPIAMVPGTAMFVRVPMAQDRADLIAYLKLQIAPGSANPAAPPAKKS